MYRYHGYALPIQPTWYGTGWDGMGWDLMGFINYLGYGACHGSWPLMAMTSNPSPSLLNSQSTYHHRQSRQEKPLPVRNPGDGRDFRRRPQAPDGNAVSG